MRLLAITAFALTVLLTACADPRDSRSTSGDLSTSETRFYSFQHTLPLPVSTSPGDTLYASEIWGIHIVEVLAEGRAITGKPSYILLDDPNTGPTVVHSGAYIYSINLSQMLFGKLSRLGYDLFEYEIPESTEELMIRYRLVPYDSEPDPRVYTLTARRIG